MIKKVTILLLFTLCLYSAELKLYKDFEDIEGSKAFVLVVEDYCPWCKKFKKEILKDQEVIAALLGHKTAVLMKNEWNKEGLGHVRYVPAIFFLDKDKTIVARHDGYMNKDDFIDLINSLQ